MIWVILVVVIAGVLLWAWAVGQNKKEALQAYLNSLANLKSDPRNPDLRQHTLALGRIYSNLMRDNKGQTVFDEVALMNDINAACAGALEFQSEKPAISAPNDIEARLEKLVSLKDRNLIDQNEYAARRREILESI
ncbi:hypothetical protein KJF94_18785 [Pseudomonas hormoni]|uniref:SHOCT domain-containing protein n=1 Tax=Pseudomonas hormoni TaxID=3093767 RepID=A0ABX8ERC7_9PSED|nr:SHOCT domain-containing protein [Pseudomonas hormoni]QVW21925.1 hypothetical protein KJF94_18785 [Pseudomonas hormoni]